MSDRTRQRGRFIKKKVLAKKMKALAASLQARTPQPRTDRENLEVIPCHGRRIVELIELGKNLRCCKCSKVLSLENIVKETRLGLNSCLTVSCEICCVNTSVLTGKMHTSKNNSKLSDVNTKIVLGKCINFIIEFHIFFLDFLFSIKLSYCHKQELFTLALVPPL